MKREQRLQNEKPNYDLIKEVKNLRLIRNGETLIEGNIDELPQRSIKELAKYGLGKLWESITWDSINTVEGDTEFLQASYNRLKAGTWTY